MKKRTKRVMGLLAITAGALGAAGALLIKMKEPRRRRAHAKKVEDVWARPGMSVTFRAELKPGRSAAERTFRVAQLLPNGRVIVEGITGEHTETEFEPIK